MEEGERIAVCQWRRGVLCVENEWVAAWRCGYVWISRCGYAAAVLCMRVMLALVQNPCIHGKV